MDRRCSTCTRPSSAEGRYTPRWDSDPDRPRHRRKHVVSHDPDVIAARPVNAHRLSSGDLRDVGRLVDVQERRCVGPSVHRNPETAVAGPLLVDEMEGIRRAPDIGPGAVDREHAAVSQRCASGDPDGADVSLLPWRGHGSRGTGVRLPVHRRSGDSERCCKQDKGRIRRAAGNCAFACSTSCCSANNSRESETFFFRALAACHIDAGRAAWCGSRAGTN